MVLELNFITESSESKFEILRRGNKKSFKQNEAIAKETMSKEDKHIHLMVCVTWVVKFSKNMRHTPQGMVIKSGKNLRVVWDTSMKLDAPDVVLNYVTSIEKIT